MFGNHETYGLNIDPQNHAISLQDFAQNQQQIASVTIHSHGNNTQFIQEILNRLNALETNNWSRTKLAVSIEGNQAVITSLSHQKHNWLFLEITFCEPT